MLFCSSCFLLILKHSVRKFLSIFFLPSHIFSFFSLSLFLNFSLFSFQTISRFFLRLSLRISFSYVITRPPPPPTVLIPINIIRSAFKPRKPLFLSDQNFRIDSFENFDTSFVFLSLPASSSSSPSRGVEILFDDWGGGRGGPATYVRIYRLVYITVLRDYSKRCLLPTRFCTSHELFLPFLSPFIPLFFSRCPSSLPPSLPSSLSLSLSLRPSILFLASLSVDSSWGSWRRGDALPNHPLTTSQRFSISIKLTFQS